MAEQDSLISASWCPPPPDAAEPQDRKPVPGCVRKSLAHTRWRIQKISGAVTDLLRRHFANDAWIVDANLRAEPATIWREGVSTGILIETVGRFLAAQVEQRPALMIKRNSYRNLQVLLDDHAGTDSRGWENYATFWTGSHTVFAIARQDAVSELLSEEVRDELHHFGPLIRGYLGLHKFRVIEVGEAAIVEEATQSFAVPVTIGWSFQDEWILQPDARPTGSIAINASAE